jgi:hypothetical protein
MTISTSLSNLLKYEFADDTGADNEPTARSSRIVPRPCESYDQHEKELT